MQTKPAYAGYRFRSVGVPADGRVFLRRLKPLLCKQSPPSRAYEPIKVGFVCIRTALAFCFSLRGFGLAKGVVS
ncbi:MAG: hypothetical protein RMJ83_10070 [Armatimonadota bacterium]|nr:hypothetical protein [Armatimonadota bacterium]